MSLEIQNDKINSFFFQYMLFIFDVNGVLCKAIKKSKATFRPGLRELFDVIAKEDDIKVAFWTSKMIHNGEPLIKNVLEQAGHPEIFDKAVFRWYSTECTRSPTIADPYAVVKDLRRVWKKFPQYSQDNTLLLDDDRYKAGAYAESNLLLIPAFIGDKSDRVLFNLSQQMKNLQPNSIAFAKEVDL